MDKAFIKNVQDATPIWQQRILWAVLAEGKDTDNSFSFIWELCPKLSGHPPHYHDQHEGFFIIDGSITYIANGETLNAGPQSFVWIPNGTVHSFRVDTEQATLLNFYTPAGFEQTILQLGTEAKAFTLPPPGFKDAVDENKMMNLFKTIGMHTVDEPDVLRESH